MRIGILGSGLMGAKLGTLWARGGHEVTFSYARSQSKLERLAKDSQGKAKAGTPREAVEGADALLLAVHWDQVQDLLAQAGDLSGKVVLSTVLPMSSDNAGLKIGLNTSGGEELCEMAPKARLVAAFNTVPSEVFFKVYADRDKFPRPSLVFCGDDEGAKAIASTLIKDVGFDPVDAGPMRISRYIEPLGLLVGQLAYEMGPSAELSYRFEWKDQRHF